MGPPASHTERSTLALNPEMEGILQVLIRALCLHSQGERRKGVSAAVLGLKTLSLVSHIMVLVTAPSASLQVGAN